MSQASAPRDLPDPSSERGSPAPNAQRPTPLMVALLLIVAFAFLGSRGIWDPDEGRYTNVALNMLKSGNWVDLMRNEDIGHWTKPPLTYWTIAGSVASFGRSPGAARLPMALSYLACVWLAWRISRRLVPGAELFAGIAYATMLLPFGASQLVTTDFVLTALQTLAMLCFVECRFGDPARARWWSRWMWVSFGLAFLTKGPPALLPLLAVVAFDAWVPKLGRTRVFTVANLALFAAVALPWFVIVGMRHPGLLGYFIGSEVYARVATDKFGRHGSWYGWLEIYGPTLLLGTIPWTGLLWRWLRREVPTWRQWRDSSVHIGDASLLLLTLWIAIPLLVFCLARSRLPLYVLPLFVPLAMVAARQWRSEARPLPSTTFLCAWATVLLALKVAASFWPTDKNASEWADAVRERVPYRVTEVLFVDDMARYGLNMHLDAEIEKIARGEPSSVPFNPEYDETLFEELVEDEPGALYIARQSDWPALDREITKAGYQVTVWGTPYRGRVMFSVSAAGRVHRGTMASRMERARSTGVAPSLSATLAAP